MRTTTLLLCASALLGACAADLTSGSGGGADLTTVDRSKPIRCWGIPTDFIAEDRVSKRVYEDDTLFYEIELYDVGNKTYEQEADARVKIGYVTRLDGSESPYQLPLWANRANMRAEDAVKSEPKTTASDTRSDGTSGPTIAYALDVDQKGRRIRFERKGLAITSFVHDLPSNQQLRLKPGHVLHCINYPDRIQALGNRKSILAFAYHFSQKRLRVKLGRFMKQRFSDTSATADGAIAVCGAPDSEGQRCTYEVKPDHNPLELSERVLANAAFALDLIGKPYSKGGAVIDANIVAVQFALRPKSEGVPAEVSLYLSEWGPGAPRERIPNKYVFELRFDVQTRIGAEAWDLSLSGVRVLSNAEAAELLWQPQGS